MSHSLSSSRTSGLTICFSLFPSFQTLSTSLVLAPTDEAFSALRNNAPTGDDLLNAIRYHIINSTLAQNDDNKPANHHDPDSEFDDLVVRSTLLSGSEVTLPGDRSQVVVIKEFERNDTFYIQEAGRNVSFVSKEDGPLYENLRIQPITQVLKVPGPLTTTIDQLNLTQLAFVLNQTDLINPLNQTENGLTIFAPENAAFEMILGTFVGISSDEQKNLLQNHVLMNQVVYTTQLPDDEVGDPDK